MSYIQVNSTQNGQAVITIKCGVLTPNLPLTGTNAYYIITPIPGTYAPPPISTNAYYIITPIPGTYAPPPISTNAYYIITPIPGT
ncbi:MAG: hypothetical protein QXP36_11795 [Conexivisphaerales archaeon]